MQAALESSPRNSSREPWNKGKLIRAKPPLRPKHVWSIRTKLQVEGQARDLAMFNLAIDGKLRGCDVVALKIDDIAPGGYAIDRATVRQKKTGSRSPVPVGGRRSTACSSWPKRATYLYDGHAGRGSATLVRADLWPAQSAACPTRLMHRRTATC
jgi:hypothetical protein